MTKVIKLVDDAYALAPSANAMDEARECNMVALTLGQWASLDFDPTVYWFSDFNDSCGLDPWSTPDIDQARDGKMFFVGNKQAPATKHIFVSLKELTSKRK